MLDYDPVTSVQHFPMDMSRFGKTPYGGALYRIVFAKSRRELICGVWPDGSNCAQWLVKYEQFTRRFDRISGKWIGKDCWVLEQWMPPQVSREIWDSQYLILGPYPSRGDYEFMHAFLEAPPTVAQVEKLITWSRYGREHNSANDLTVYRRSQLEAAQKTKDETTSDMIRERLPAFGHLPMAAHGGSRGDKTWKPVRTAEELGLPTTGGMRTGKHVRQLIESAA
jgi:hypothetical protein